MTHSPFSFIFFLHFGMALDIPKPFISTSLTCYTYKRKNEQTTKRVMDDCMFGNACCYSAEFINKQSGETVEFGGCEDEYRFMVGTHPILGNMLPITISYICDEGSCVERSTSHDTARLCACKENNCNENGIDGVISDYQERVRKGLVKRPPDFANLVEQTVQMLING
uniref:Activin_recp domain-containing protein n=1 Tax=Elaeophora elaphi TaxID=1147741 RepID=A0A0R3RIN4_9BILA